METESELIKPDEDIDETHDVETLRIERMKESSIWVAGYENGKQVCRFMLMATDDGRLKVKRSTYDRD